MNGVGAGFRDDVDDASGAAAELRVGAARRDLEFLDSFQRDVNRGALATHLFAEESVVVVATVEADVVEDAPLPVDIDLVAVRTLSNADAGGQCQQVFKFAPEHRCRCHGDLVKGRRGGRLRNFHNRHVANDDLLCDRRYLHGDGQRNGLAYGEVHIFLNDRGEPGLADGERVVAWRKTQERKVTIRVRSVRLHEIGREV